MSIGSPFFSIVIPVHNKKPHIRRAVDSVLQQSFEDFEIVLIDDASNDNSLDEVNDVNDQRIHVLHRDTPGPGGYAARNLGIKNSNSDWVAFLDADDEWTPDHLELAYNVIINHPQAEIISSGWTVQDGKGIPKPDNYFITNKNRGIHAFGVEQFIQSHRPIWTGVAIVKKSLLTKVGGFDENWRHGADLSMWLDLLFQKDQKAYWIPKVTAIYHTDSINMVTSQKTQYQSPETELIRCYLSNNHVFLGDKDQKKALIRYGNRKALVPFVRSIVDRNSKINSLKNCFIFSRFDLKNIFKAIFILILPKNLLIYYIK